MITNKKKFKNGVQKIAIAFGLAFTGPIVFVLNSTSSNIISSLLTVIGMLLMIGAVIIGVLGVHNLLAGFFEKPNE